MDNNNKIWMDSPSTYKTGEMDISTIYGTKHVNVYSYYYSGAQRTALTPEDCYIPFKYTTDSGGSYVIGTLSYTNIVWLKNA